MHKDNSTSSSYGYEHSAISSRLPCSISNIFRRRKRGDVAKGGSTNPTPPMKTIEENLDLLDTFPRARSSLDEESSSQKEDMKIPLSKVDQDLRSPIDDEAFSTIEDKARGDIIVITKAPLAFHEEEEGVAAPRREALAFLQGVSKSLTYRDYGTIHE